MKILVFLLAFLASALVMGLYLAADNTVVATIWGVTTGIWASNVINALMED